MTESRGGRDIDRQSIKCIEEEYAEPGSKKSKKDPVIRPEGGDKTGDKDTESQQSAIPGPDGYRLWLLC